MATEKAPYTLNEGDSACISLATLYPALKESANGRRTRCGDLVRHSVDGDSDWYDLLEDGNPEPACCDGETCVVTRVCPDGTTYFRNGETGRTFVLSPEETGIAAFRM